MDSDDNAKHVKTTSFIWWLFLIVTFCLRLAYWVCIKWIKDLLFDISETDIACYAQALTGHV